jgi:hypothetical protein
MESGELTDFTGAFIKASLTSAEALLGLINQILDFAKFEGAKDANGRYNGASAIELSEDVWTVRQLMEQVTDMTQKATSALDAEPGDRDAENGANLDADFSASSAAARRAVQTETSDTSERTAANAKKARSEKRPDIVVTLATPEHFNTAFVGDFFRLRQCCVNLVDNAVKYSTGVVGRDALVELVVTVTDVARDAETSELSSSSFSSANTNRGGDAWSDDEDSADFADFAQALTPHARASLRGSRQRRRYPGGEAARVVRSVLPARRAPRGEGERHRLGFSHHQVHRGVHGRRDRFR